MGRIIIDFFGISLLCAIAFAIFAHFFPNLGSPSGAVSSVIASLIAGQFYGRRTGEEVSSAFAWKVAAILTILSIILAIIILFSLLAQAGPELKGSISLVQSAGVLGFFALLSLLAIRFTFRMGVKQGVKTLKQ